MQTIDTPQELVPATTDAPTERKRAIKRLTLASLLPNQKGMTLVEIMIVLTILAGIMVAVGVYAFDALDRAKIQESRIRLNKVSAQIQGYYAFTSPNAMPEALQDLVKPPGGEPPYLKEGDIKDAWGQDIIYNKTSNRGYELRSPGPDGSDGGEDDIVLAEGR